MNESYQKLDNIRMADNISSALNDMMDITQGSWHNIYGNSSCSYGNHK